LRQHRSTRQTWACSSAGLIWLPRWRADLLAGRVGTPRPAGNEGAGTVVAAGGSAAARALRGRVVAAAGGGMCAQCRAVNVALCLELPAGATAIDGAA
jgi:NADPH:quinone reductase